METNVSSNSWQSPKFILTFVGLILVFAVIIVALVRERIISNPQWQVSIVGRGTVEYQPDKAVVNMGVRVDRAATAESALSQLTQRIGSVLEAIEEAGISRDQVTTEAYALYPEYDYVNERQVLAGYTAHQIVEVTVHGIQDGSETLSNLLDGASRAGVNQVNGITFDVADVNRIKDQARVKAINDAREKARDTAAAAGIRLGKVVGWWENFIEDPSAPYYADGKGGGGTGLPAVPSGTQEIIVEVSLSYLVK